ncbi:MAG: glucodextranase DOMON-like domain-containing protein, partial [Candidatus Eisenbacteria bacterium]
MFPARSSSASIRAVRLAPAVFFLCLALSPSLSSASQVVTQLSDPAGDDYGPGTYSYPTNDVFAPGSFDFTGFEVSYDASSVYFALTIAASLSDPWGSGAGFSLQSIDVYVDKDGISGSGATWTLEARNARVSPVNGWEVMVWCAPPFDGFRSRIVFPDGSGDTTGVRTQVEQAAGRITISVPRTSLGTPSGDWKYIVLMLGQNGFEPGRIRPVRLVNDEWSFGGGTDGNSDSNVIDMVTVPGLSQEGMLSNYDPATSQVCALFAEPDGVAPSIVHTPVAGAQAHLPVHIEATVVDSFVAAANVHYRRVGESQFRTSGLNRGGLQTWAGEIPGEDVEEGILEYFLHATDGLAASTLPADTLQPFQLSVSPDTTGPVVSDAYVCPVTFYPDGDGFRDSTTAFWQLSEPCLVTVRIRNAQGFAVRTLRDSTYFGSGHCEVCWDGRNDSGGLCAEGTYGVVVNATDLSGRDAVPETTQAILSLGAARKQLDAVFLFHLNQNLVPYSKVASAACYVGLLETLRSHPGLKFMIHVSGCLLHSLLWLDRRAVDLVMDGVEAGQFEIVGSTYSQNIMYSTRTDSTDFQFNDQQIKVHRMLIEKVFGVSPVSFWNPERTWTQNFVRLLGDNGFSSVQVEDHILFDSGISGSEYLVRRTSYDGRSVNVFDDDKSFEGVVNYAIDSGDYQSVLNFLHARYGEDVDDRFAVCYHEDAEATGLWDYENGEHPSVDWSHLDALLTALEADPLVNVTTYSEFLRDTGPSSSVGRIVDGAAEWMGGSAWFAENDSPTGVAYRQLFDQIRDTLNAVRQEIASAGPDTVAASRLLEHAWFDLVAHQYEFLVHGEVGHDGYVDWEMARASYVPARAAREALLRRNTQYIEDLNKDGVEEIVVVNATDMLVFSRKGGKLLYWFSMADGAEEVGGENFLHYNELFEDESHYVRRLVGGRDAYTWLSGNNVLPEVFDWEFEVRRRAFEDSLLIDGSYAGEIRNAMFSASLKPGGVELTYETSAYRLKKS